MLHHSYTRREIHPRLPEGSTEISLTSYVRPRTGEMLADNGARWAVLILPGGGYTCTAFGEGEPVALSFLAAGVQAFVLNYSVAPDRWPLAFLETAAALAWIRDRHETFGIRPDRIALCGFSAGGHLAGCVSNLWRQEAARIEEVLGLSAEWVKPDRAILCYPVISAAHDPDSGTFAQLRGDRPLDPRLSLETISMAGDPTPWATARRSRYGPRTMWTTTPPPGFPCASIGSRGRRDEKDRPDYRRKPGDWRGLCAPVCGGGVRGGHSLPPVGGGGTGPGRGDRRPGGTGPAGAGRSGRQRSRGANG